jgi:hypothetical protein
MLSKLKERLQQKQIKMTKPKDRLEVLLDLEEDIVLAARLVSLA